MTAFLGAEARWAASFRYRDFRLLWVSTFFQSLGMGMDQVALGWLVLEMTDSPFMVTVSFAARMAPFFFLGVLSGAIADRVDRRLFVRSVTFGGSIVAGSMAVLLLTDTAQVWHVMALAVAIGSVFAVYMTVSQAYAYDIVGPENALNGLSLIALSQRAGGVGGAVLAGAIIATVGVGGQYLAAGASYLVATAVLLATRDVGETASTRRQPVLQNLVEYVQLLRGTRTLLILMALAATTEIFGFTHQSLLPVFAKDVLGVGAMGLGVMVAFRQGGGIVGLVLLASLGDFRSKGRLIFITAGFFGLGLMAFYVVSGMLLFVAILAFVNACAAVVDTLYRTLMQANVPNEQRGRAMGSWVLSIGVAPVGYMAVGAMAGAFGAPLALLINGGVLVFASAGTAAGLPKIRRLP